MFRKVIVASALLALACTVQAQLAGDVIDAAIINTVDNGYGTGRVVGSGLEGPFTVANGPSDAQTYANLLSLDVDDGGFRLQFLDYSGFQPGVVLRLSGLDFSAGAEQLVDVVADNTLAGYTLSWGRDWVELGLGLLDVTPDDAITGQFKLRPAANTEPEPAGLGMAALALLALLALARRRQRGKDATRS